MSERYRFINVGPLDDGGAIALGDELRARYVGVLDIELLDDRRWYARALDVDSVRHALPVLRAGLLDQSLPYLVRHSVMGLVSDMESWLDREFDNEPRG